MARTRSENQTRLMVGAFVISLLALAFVALFVIGQKGGAWKKRTEIRTDFRTITGLRRGSPVQLSGVEIGSVEAIDFVTRSYECDPLTEDVGRFGAGRTDNCDEFTFCSPVGRCAELEQYASRPMHAPCLSPEDCAETEICVTKDFRGRARRVHWAGPDGVCARYSTEQRRVEVKMSVFDESLAIICTDSRATVSSNGVLGDQLVNITPGSRQPLGELPPEQRRIQSEPSLFEDIDLLRGRLDGLSNKVDETLSGLSNFFSELNDEHTIAALKGSIQEIHVILRQIADGEGMVGALINDKQYKEDAGKTLRSLKNTAEGVDRFVGDANRSIAKIEKNLDPAIDDFRSVLSRVSGILADLKDPNNQSVAAKLLYDKDGKWAKDFEATIANARSMTEKAATITARIENGEGTIGRLINDSKPYDDLVKILRDQERNTTFKRMVRYVIELDEDEGKGAKKKTQARNE